MELRKRLAKEHPAHGPAAGDGAPHQKRPRAPRGHPQDDPDFYPHHHPAKPQPTNTATTSDTRGGLAYADSDEVGAVAGMVFLGRGGWGAEQQQPQSHHHHHHRHTTQRHHQPGLASPLSQHQLPPLPRGRSRHALAGLAGGVDAHASVPAPRSAAPRGRGGEDSDTDSSNSAPAAVDCECDSRAPAPGPFPGWWWPQHPNAVPPPAHMQGRVAAHQQQHGGWVPPQQGAAAPFAAPPPPHFFYPPPFMPPPPWGYMPPMMPPFGGPSGPGGMMPPYMMAPWGPFPMMGAPVVQGIPVIDTRDEDTDGPDRECTTPSSRPTHATPPVLPMSAPAQPTSHTSGAAAALGLTAPAAAGQVVTGCPVAAAASAEQPGAAVTTEGTKQPTPAAPPIAPVPAAPPPDGCELSVALAALDLASLRSWVVEEYCEDVYLLLLDAWRPESPLAPAAVASWRAHVAGPRTTPPDYGAFLSTLLGVDRLAALTAAARAAGPGSPLIGEGAVREDEDDEQQDNEEGCGSDDGERREDKDTAPGLIPPSLQLVAGMPPAPVLDHDTA